MSAPTTMRAAVATGATHGTILGVLIFAAILAGNWLTAPVVPPAPQPPAPVVVPAAAPESWIVLDAQGVRVTDPAIEKVAGSLKAGRWTAQGIPKPGERGVTLSITIDDGVKPPVPPTPEPPKPPEPVPPPVVEGPRSVLIIRESAADSPEFARLLVGIRNGEAAGYLKARGHKLYILDDDAIDAVTDKWRPHYAGLSLPAVFIISDKGELVHKQAIDGKASDPNVVLDILKAHGG
jgi:hypothetical protein